MVKHQTLLSCQLQNSDKPPLFSQLHGNSFALLHFTKGHYWASLAMDSARCCPNSVHGPGLLRRLGNKFSISVTHPIPALPQRDNKAAQQSSISLAALGAAPCAEPSQMEQGQLRCGAGSAAASHTHCWVPGCALEETLTSGEGDLCATLLLYNCKSQIKVCISVCNRNVNSLSLPNNRSWGLTPSSAVLQTQLAFPRKAQQVRKFKFSAYVHIPVKGQSLEQL